MQYTEEIVPDSLEECHFQKTIISCINNGNFQNRFFQNDIALAYWILTGAVDVKCGWPLLPILAGCRHV